MLGRALLAAVDAAAGRTSLELGDLATQSASAISITGGDADLDTMTLLEPLADPVDHVPGRFRWSLEDEAPVYDTNKTGVTATLNQEDMILVRNNSGDDYFNGQPVIIQGATGRRPVVVLASAATVTADKTIGLLTCDIPAHSWGYCTTQGLTKHLNTLGSEEGDVLYLGTVPGTLVTTPPAPPNAVVCLAVNVWKNAAGTYFVRPRVVPRIAACSDVDLTGLADQDVLQYDSASFTWKPRAVSATGSAIVSYSTALTAVTGTENHTLSPSAALQQGLAYRVTLTNTLGSGTALLQIYEDAGRTSLVWESLVDLTNPLLDNDPWGYESDVAAGTLYLTITNNTGGPGDFQLDIQAYNAGTVVTSPDPAAGSPGDGLTQDGLGRFMIDLAGTSGLELDGATPNKVLRVAAGNGLQRTAGGLAIDTAVTMDLATAQTVAGRKQFSSLAGTPAATSGPPTTGARLLGDLYLDADGDWWRCTVAGTPGTWVLLNNVTTTFWSDGEATETAAGATRDLSFDLKGRRGQILKATIWADKTVPATFDEPFRLQIYPTENYYGRDMIAEILCQGRATTITVQTAVPTSTVDVASVGAIHQQDLILVAATEFARVTVRRTTPSIQVDLAEQLIGGPYLAGASVPVCTEVCMIPFYNESSTPAEYRKLFLRFVNDSSTTAMAFYCKLDVEQFSGA